MLWQQPKTLNACRKQQVMSCSLIVFPSLSFLERIPKYIPLLYFACDFFPLQTSFLPGQFDAVGWSWSGWCEPCDSATLPPCSSVLVCPCLASPPLDFPPVVSFLRASSSEPKQQLHLFCQDWECTQPSLALLLPAPVHAKPVDLPPLPDLLFLFLSFTVSVWVCDSASGPTRGAFWVVVWV